MGRRVQTAILLQAWPHQVGTSCALSMGLFCILEEKICNRCPRMSRTQSPLKFHYCAISTHGPRMSDYAIVERELGTGLGERGCEQPANG